MTPHRRGFVLFLVFLLFAFVALEGHAEEPVISFTPNPLLTTPFGPAKADILLRASNFLPCVGGPIALCYYSGPQPSDASQPDLSCDVTSDGGFANCRCIEIPHGPYFVDINAILDVDMYARTVKVCGKDGVDCQRERNSAPVCRAINENRFIAGADTISTFSLALDTADPSEFKIGQTNCPVAVDETALYAGCMTAPCTRTTDSIQINGSAYPIDECACPTFDGRYQVGQTLAQPNDPDSGCVLGDGEPGDKVWSAAYNPLLGDTTPSPGCIPDAPTGKGCPLLSAVPGSDPPEPIIPAKPGNISCGKVCAEYRQSRQADVEVGYTCDATLCTATGKDFQLVKDACTGLRQGTISEILLLETEVGCSCCASQICGCQPGPQTNAQILELNKRQRDRNITPQCNLNGTLCGGRR
jgi:hypothetical protein